MKKKTLRKLGILLAVFIGAVIFCFLAAQKTMKKEDTVYSAMGAPTLPVVYARLGDKNINCMHGYVQDMGNKAARDSLTVLPDDRALQLEIMEYGNTITEAFYEIRNLSMDRLVENGEVNSWEETEEGVLITLPIQNMIAKEEPYLLTLTLGTGEKEIYYYTRILWSDNHYGEEFVNLAEQFSVKTMDYNQARDLVSYLETDPVEDNSSLGSVTIRTSFDHLTWDGLSVNMTGTPQVTLKELEGTMGQVQVNYQVSLAGAEGGATLLDVEDYFTMRWNEQRIYMMNYHRTANEIFTGEADRLSGKRLMLGITNDDMVSAMKSENSRYTAFRANRELWSYDSRENRLVKVFSFRSQGDDGVRSGYGQHDIKILGIRDNGDIEFLVYGYMNRGEYEGSSGAVLYRYRQETGTLQERIFIPVAEPFDRLKLDVGQLAYLNENGMLYILLDGAVYGIDLNSNESMVVAQGLTGGSFGVSEDGSRLAWQEGDSPFQSEKIHLMDFDTAEKQEITGNPGDYARVLGFVGSDLVYGLGRPEDVWRVNGRVQDLMLYSVCIIGENMEMESQYQQDGAYIADVQVEDGRIHLKKMAKAGEGVYVFQDNDTIVCNEDLGVDPLEGIGWYASQERGKLYFVQMDSELSPEGLRVMEPEQISYENTGTLETAAAQGEEQRPVFYAYVQGKLAGETESFTEAVNMAYDEMGVVTDSSQHIVWDRINKRTAANIQDPLSKAGEIISLLPELAGSQVTDKGLFIIDAKGCSLSQMQYFIDKGYPVIAYTGGGGYLLISGYDQYNVTLFDPQTQESWKMGLNDATAYFEGLQNDFVCAKQVE